MPDTHTSSFYDPDAIFHEDGPLDPRFMLDAIQTLMRSMPLDTDEPEAAQRRRMTGALIALAATNPRDPIEVMLAIQALCAYQAASACWRIGMNARRPRGDSTRHISAASTAARTFEAMLRAMERRQAKPLSVPVGRPAPRVWPRDPGPATLDLLADRIKRDNAAPVPELRGKPPEPVTWTAEALAIAKQMEAQARFEKENEGLDLANTEGILPCGGIIMPEDPTPNQAKYIARRLTLMYRREITENRRKGIMTNPKIRPLRTGDFVP